MNCLNPALIFSRSDFRAPDAAAQVYFGQKCFRALDHQIKMGVRKFAASHNITTELQLLRHQFTGPAPAAAMKIITKIMRIVPLVSLQVIGKNNYPNIMGVRPEGLKDKRKRQDTQRGLVIDIFHPGPEMNTQACIFAVKFGYYPADFFSVVEIDGSQHIMSVMDAQSMGQHERGKKQGLKNLGAAGLLGQGRREKTHSALQQVKEHELFAGLKPDSAQDKVGRAEIMKFPAQSIIIPDNQGAGGRRRGQNSISTNR